MTEYVLDTSALLTLIENEDGIKFVENLIENALKEKCLLYVSVVSLIELFYISLREQGHVTAAERLNLLNDLPIIHEQLTENLIEEIGAIKAANSLSFADCCIAGLAKYRNATLVHKDPEYEQLDGSILQHKLPYKAN
jgi:predicted nucleic acid-binding protein